jgi:excinuclease ABC subunit C
VTMSTTLAEKLKNIPKKPGVYRYFDAQGTLLYIGKAKNLKNRVSSYFVKTLESAKTRQLVSKIADIKYIVTDSEYDALLLENTLVKEYQPRYNIQLRDDKTYPWIVIKKEPFPRVFPTRNLIKDGSEYFGPYASVKTMYALLDFLRKMHPLRTCNLNLTDDNIKSGKFKTCLEFQIGNCMAPCVGKQTHEDYDRHIRHIRKILKGNIAEVIKENKEQMQQHADRMEFEVAQEIKERIALLEHYQARSTVVQPYIHNIDVFSIICDDKFGYVNYMKIMSGCVIQSHTIELKKKLDEAEEELLLTAIIELRHRFNSNSEEIFVNITVDADWPGIKFHIPQRGDKKLLTDMSLRNAKYFMRDRHLQQEKTDPDRHKNRVLGKLQSDLRMQVLPEHIECFDNSNIQGAFPVAACVVFKDAKPSKKDYRHFNIKTVEGPDDFASMREVIYRRYSRMLEENIPLPQLVIIDGGKGQLSSAVESLKKLAIYGQVTVVGIAKKLEEIYFPGDSFPIYIDKRSESLKLIQQLRNEAHRFGITHHRNRRSKGTIKTGLEEIPGIGPKTAEKLLRHFNSVKRIKMADTEALAEVVGHKTALKIKKELKE